MTKTLLRTLAFIGKEIQAIFVQPQLLLLLVAGPFIVLLAFGAGYRPSAPQLRTIIVETPEAGSERSVSLHLQSIGPPLQIQQVTADTSLAFRELRARRTDLVVVVPSGARETILAGQVVRLQFYHNAIDPGQIGYLQAVIDGATNQLNKAIIKQTVSEQQASGEDYEQLLAGLQQDLDGIQAALDSGDRARAQQLARNVRLNSTLVASLWLLGANPLSGEAPPAGRLAQQARELDTLLASPDSNPESIRQVTRNMRSDTGRMLQALRRSRRISPEVFAAPLAWEAQNIMPYQPGYVAYHSPTVLALLIQHLCITLAALSLVDERSAGAVELFRASPVRPTEILLGKFLAYMIFIAAVSAALVALLLFGLRVPLLGDWRWLVLTLAVLVVYSLNLGFLISALARSRSQAIQMSMLVLLGSIFFSGLFVPVADFALPVRAVSYSLPITYGMEELRQVVLRGERPGLLFLSIMILWGAVLGVLARKAFRKMFWTEQWH